MKEISITTQFKAFDAIPDLPTDIQEFVASRCSQKNAYAPYSKFRVELQPFR
jgi:hypothetical protein